jgi:signal transduction histidine kinase
MNELFEKILQQIKDGIVMFDISGKVTFSNLEQSRFQDIVVNNRIAEASIMKTVAEMAKSETNKLQDIELNILKSVKNDNHSVIFQSESTFCLYIRDELNNASFNALRDNMFTLINHELRTPMGHFTSCASFISNILKVNKGKINDIEEFQYFVKVVTDSVTEVTTKMERLLELAKTFGDDPMLNNERVQLVDTAHAAIDGLIDMSLEKNITIRLEQKCDVIGNLYGSFGWLKRAIEECIRNSIEHSTRGGEIVVEIEQKKFFASIIIRNFGLEISPKVIQTLFDPFVGGGDKEEFSNQGLGIGLSLARKVIEDHGGNIKNVEIPDGVEFHIELPTGGFILSSNDLDIRQSQLYAKDLVSLIKKKQLITFK